MSEVKHHHVHFSSKVCASKTIARGDYTQDELYATWFSHEDLKGITMACSKQIQKLDNGERLRDKKYCARGLEQHTRLAAILKKKCRMESIDAVLTEQESQRHEGMHDVDAIARAYHNVTSSCQMWANSAGLCDERAMEALQDDDEEFKPASVPARPPVGDEPSRNTPPPQLSAGRTSTSSMRSKGVCETRRVSLARAA